MSSWFYSRGTSYVRVVRSLSTTVFNKYWKKLPQDVRDKSKMKGVGTQEEAVMVVELEDGSKEAVAITVRHVKFILPAIWPEIMKRALNASC